IEESGSPSADEVTALLRSLHTLKGNSGMLGLRALVDTVHAVEGVFKEPEPAFSRDRLDLLFEAAAAARQAVEQAGTDGQERAFARLRDLKPAARLDSTAEATGAAERPSTPHAPAEPAPDSASPPGETQTRPETASESEG